MFSQANPVIVQIRRELRGALPDDWIDEIISLLECELTYKTMDEMTTNDLIKLRIAASFSGTLNRLLVGSMAQTDTYKQAAKEPNSSLPRLPWQ
jgi:hypothetical protein